MLAIYNLVLSVVSALIKLYGRFSTSKSKFSLLAQGQIGLLSDIEKQMQGHRRGMTVWFHAASLGEYAVARPLIRSLKQQGECTIVLTFFSSTGYLALKDSHPDVDYLFYLPLDTRRSARRFLDAVQPDRVVWIISEYWCNHLAEIRRRGIRAYLVSAKIRPTSVFFRWYGLMFRRAIAVFTHFFVLDEASKQRLASIGYRNVTVSGNPLFDNAAAMAATPWKDAVIERFAAQKVFVAGSVSDANDEELVCHLANQHTDTRFIIVPHELRSETIQRIRSAIKGRSMLYSECNEATDFADTQVLIVDVMGILAYVYRYAKWAYVGGGFTKYLHSVVEATVYGIPISFGPNIYRKVTPSEMIEIGIGQSVSTAEELDQWFSSLKHNDKLLDEIRAKAHDYIDRNTGKTQFIIDMILADSDK